MDKIKEILKCFHRANKAEIEEIKELVVTDEDKAQAEAITVAAMAALAACGVSITNTSYINTIMQTAVAYGLRDLKDGLETPKKLLVHRIVDEIKQAKIDGNLA